MSVSPPTSTGSESTAPPPAADDLISTIALDADPGETLGIPEREVHELQAQDLDRVVDLGEELGRGGMAIVRQAQQRVLDRPVAVKSARLEDGRSDGVLLLEARITGALEHPAILPVHDIVVDASGRPHILMKRVLGAPWSELIRDGDEVRARFGAEDLFDWNLQIWTAVCHALEFAHAANILHRDLKPDNVMVAAYGQVYVLDWGIAVSTDASETRFPRVGELDRISGTPRYMAPEMLTRRGLKGLSAQTDVYLLGGLLYHIIEGRPPHRGLTVTQILEGIPSFVPELHGADPELAGIVKRAMAPEQDERFGSVAELRKAVQAFRSHRGAVEIAARANASHQELQELLADEDAERIRVYDLFGQVRFGFLECLRVHPEHEVARAGLSDCLQAMAVWELDQGDDRAAEVLLSQLADVPGGLSERLDEARAHREDQQALLVRLAHRADPAVGHSVRVFALTVMMVLWTINPALNLLAVWVDYVTSAVFFGIALALVVAGWEQLMATRRNRIFSGILLTGMLCNLLLTMGPVTGALTHHQMLHAVWALNGSFCLLAGVLLERSLFVPGTLFWLGFLASAWVDPIRPIVATLLNGVLGVSALWSFLRK